MAAQLSTVSSRSSAALPLSTEPQPLVLQDRRNGDDHVVLCMLASLSPWSVPVTSTLLPLHCLPYGRRPAGAPGCVQISGNNGLRMTIGVNSAICFLELDSEATLSV